MLRAHMPCYIMMLRHVRPEAASAAASPARCTTSEDQPRAEPLVRDWLMGPQKETKKDVGAYFRRQGRRASAGAACASERSTSGDRGGGARADVIHQPHVAPAAPRHSGLAHVSGLPRGDLRPADLWTLRLARSYCWCYAANHWF